MNKEKLAIFEKELSDLILKHVGITEVRNVGSFCFDYLPKALFEFYKANSLLNYHYGTDIMGAAGLVALDNLCVYESVKELLPLMRLIAEKPEMFNNSFGDADYYIEGIKKSEIKESFLENHTYIQSVVDFSISNAASGVSAKCKYTYCKYREEIVLYMNGKKVFEVEYPVGEPSEFDKSYPTMTLTKISAKYDLRKYDLINSILSSFRGVLLEINEDCEN